MLGGDMRAVRGVKVVRVGGPERLSLGRRAPARWGRGSDLRMGPFSDRASGGCGGGDGGGPAVARGCRAVWQLSEGLVGPRRARAGWG